MLFRWDLSEASKHEGANRTFVEGFCDGNGTNGKHTQMSTGFIAIEPDKEDPLIQKNTTQSVMKSNDDLEEGTVIKTIRQGYKLR